MHNVGQTHSPLCQITWTETARGAERCSFEHEFPIELRFGLHIEPGLFSSTDVITATVAFQVFQLHQNGEALRYNYVRRPTTDVLPGAPGPDLWLGVAIGQAMQLVQSSGSRQTGVFDFRPHVYFDVLDSPLSGFAVSPERHSFVLVAGRPSDGFEAPSERFVGGPGRPT